MDGAWCSSLSRDFHSTARVQHGHEFSDGRMIVKSVINKVPALLMVLAAFSFAAVHAQQSIGRSSRAHEKVLFTFPGGRKGGEPSAKLTFDSAGNLYGTTVEGGGKNTNCPFTWCGTAIELTPTSNGKWKETVLHDFTLGKDGAVPVSGLIVDHSGNVYGATANGGRGRCLRGCGVVFELTKTNSGKWKETVLHSFTGGKDGGLPGAIFLDQAGNIYGAAEQGGNRKNCPNFGCGVVFELIPAGSGKWKETVIYTFSGGSDGANPASGLTSDGSGNLYGTTQQGGNQGDCQGGCGVVFRLMPNAGGRWKQAVLHAFTGGKDGRYPFGTPVFDAAGNLYSTTEAGGNQGDCLFQGSGCGVVFELTPTSKGPWKETVLHTFTGGKDGSVPGPDLSLDVAGNIYSTAFSGGITNCFGGGYGCGVAFKLAQSPSGDWKETVLHTFTGGNDGGNPGSGLILDSKGNRYGSTSWGGADGWGVVFELKP
jgi:uncharacterized repeat protein (TIGR03803 family)